MRKVIPVVLMLMIAVAAKGQQSLAPGRAPYYDFSTGIKIQGSFGGVGACLLSTGTGSQWGTCGGAGNLPGVTSNGANGLNVVGAMALGAGLAAESYNAVPSMTTADFAASDGCTALETKIASGSTSSNIVVDARGYAGAMVQCFTDPFAGIIQSTKHASADFGNTEFNLHIPVTVPAQTYLTGANGNLSNGFVADASFRGSCPAPTFSINTGTHKLTLTCPSALTVAANQFFVLRGTNTDLDTTYKVETVSGDQKTITTSYSGTQTAYANSSMVGCTFTPTLNGSTLTVGCSPATTGLSVGSTACFSNTHIVDLDDPPSSSPLCYTVASIVDTSTFTVAYSGVANTQSHTFIGNVNAAQGAVPLIVLGDGAGGIQAVAGAKVRQFRIYANASGGADVPIALYSDTINEDSGGESILIADFKGIGLYISQDVQSWGGGGFPENWDFYGLTTYPSTSAPVNVASVIIDQQGDVPHGLGKYTVNPAGLANKPICGIQMARTIGGTYDKLHFENVVNGGCLYRVSGATFPNSTFSTTVSNAAWWIGGTGVFPSHDDVWGPIALLGATPIYSIYNSQSPGTSAAGTISWYRTDKAGGGSCMNAQSGCPFSVNGSTAVKGADGQGYMQVGFQRFSIPVSGGGAAQSVTITNTFPSTADAYTRNFECFVDLTVNLQQQYTQRYLLSMGGGINLTLLTTGYKGDGTLPTGFLTNPVLIGSPATGFSFDVANQSFAFGVTQGSVTLTCPNFNSPVVGTLTVGSPFVTTATTFPDLQLVGTNVKIDTSIELNSSAGTSGQCLVSQGAGTAPIWTTCPGGGGGSPTVTNVTTATFTAVSGYYVNKNTTTTTSIIGTLPTPVAGTQVCLTNAVNGSNVAETGQLELLVANTGTQSIIYQGQVTTSSGFIQSTGAAGDSICVLGVSSTQWLAWPSGGSWTAH